MLKSMYNNDGDFTKFSLFKLATFLLFWWIYPIVLLVFSGIFYSFVIAYKGIKVVFIFDDDTITKPKEVDQKVLTTILLFPIRLFFHLIVGLSLSIILYLIHLLPSLGIFSELANFLSCKNFKEVKEYLLNPFEGTSVPIIYYNKYSLSYDESLTRRIKMNTVAILQEKIALREKVFKIILIVCSPVIVSVILMTSMVIWLYRQLIIYAIVYSFMGLYTNSRYVGSWSHRSEYWLERDNSKNITALMVIPRIIYRITAITIQIFLLSIALIIILPLTLISSIIVFINLCVKSTYNSADNTLYKLIKEEYFSWTREEITGGIKV